MLMDFQLAALIRTGKEWRLLRIPMHQQLQSTLAENWDQQCIAFLLDRQELPFSAGYMPEADEYFRLDQFQLPVWLQAGVAGGVQHLDPINDAENLADSIKAVVAFARTELGEELMLAQGFSQSHVIAPSRFLFLEGGTYISPARPGFTLASRLTAVYRIAEARLLFENFRNTNAFLPLMNVVAEASDQEIHEVLNHALLMPQDANKTITIANQWFRKRFAMLRASGILDQYTTAQLVERSTGYEVALEVRDNRIVFPADKAAAKRVLQFLNEELFKGAITEKLYETNSKREADE